MPSILLALADLGMAMPIQETLEAEGHRVDWDGSVKSGPPNKANKHDLVILAADDFGIEDTIESWRQTTPPPAVVAVGVGPSGQEKATIAGVPYVDVRSSAQEISNKISHALHLRFAGQLSSNYSRAALGIQTTSGDPLNDAGEVVKRSRTASLDLIRNSLSAYVNHYVSTTNVIDGLRQARVLVVPEVEVLRSADGTLTLQTLIRQSSDPSLAGRLLWALASVEGVRFTSEPPDVSTTKRRALYQARRHLANRQQRLQNACLYDVLEVPPGTQALGIDGACQFLALRFAPQHLDPFDLGTLAPLRTEVWPQILNARQALYDPIDQTNYLEHLQRQGTLPTTSWARVGPGVGKAEEAFRRGQEALVTGDAFKAVSAMATACRIHPCQPDYEASLAWARYRAELARGKDRSEIVAKERATAEQSLDGRRPWPRALVALALLCAADSDPDAAQFHLFEALRCDPNLPAAKQLLQRLQQPR